MKNPTAATLNIVCTSKKLNASGEVIEERPADAHTLVNTNTLLTQFLNPYNGSSWANDTATLESNKGIILVTEYDSVTNKNPVQRSKSVPAERHITSMQLIIMRKVIFPHNIFIRLKPQTVTRRIV